MATADGVPYWKIALLHLDSIASTVVQKCIYWDTPEQCGFCGIELTRGEQTVPVKTPAMLAEVCTAARDLDHAVDVTLTTGSLNRRDRGAIYISRARPRSRRPAGCRSRSSSSRPTTCACSTRCASRRRRRRHPRRDVDPEVLARSRRARRSAASRATSARGSGRRCVRPRPRHDLRPAGHGRAAGADRRGLPAGDRDGRVPVRRAAAAGAGNADGRRTAARARLRGGDLRGVSAMLAEPGLDHDDPKAGCARCQACSGLSAWERVLRARRLVKRSRRPDVLAAAARTYRCRPAASAVDWRGTSPCAERCSSQGQALFADGPRRARRRPADAARGRRGRRSSAGAVRLYPLGRPALWKGDRLAVLPPRVTAFWAPSSCSSPSAPRGSAAAGGWWRRCRSPTCTSSSGSAGCGRRSSSTAASCTSRWTIALSVSARPECRRQVPHGGRPVERERRRRLIEAPADRARRGPARERLARLLCRPAVRSTKPKLGNVSSQRSSGRRSGRGIASRSRFAPQPASIICSSEPAMPGIDTSRLRARGPRSATSTSASPSVSQLLRVAVVQRGPERLVSLIQARRSRTRRRARRRASRSRARSGMRGEALQEADSAGVRPDREVPADDLHAELLRGPGDALEDAPACPWSGLTSMSTSASGRPPMARTSETLVTTAAAPAPNGSRARRPGDRLPADHDEAVPVRDERCVLAVDSRQRPCDEREVSLAEQPGRGADVAASASRSGIGTASVTDGPARRGGGQCRALDVRRRAARAGRVGRGGRLAPTGRRRSRAWRC